MTEYDNISDIKIHFSESLYVAWQPASIKPL